MKTNEALIPKALREVWEWKDAVYEETKDLPWEARKKYYREGLEAAAQLLNARLEKNPDGTFVFR